jgi:hypothetical protein
LTEFGDNDGAVSGRVTKYSYDIAMILVALKCQFSKLTYGLIYNFKGSLE